MTDQEKRALLLLLGWRWTGTDELWEEPDTDIAYWPLDEAYEYVIEKMSDIDDSARKYS